MKKIGYARKSTGDQKLDLQIDALKAAGCDEICTDSISGTIDNRPGLKKALDSLVSGDELVVWRLDRLARSLNHLISLVNDLDAKGIHFRSLNENIETSTSTGRLVFHIFAALGQFERELIVERTKAGLEAARKKGRVGGRPSVVNNEIIEAARALAEKENLSKGEISKLLGISRATLYRHIS